MKPTKQTQPNQKGAPTYAQKRDMARKASALRLAVRVKKPVLARPEPSKKPSLPSWVGMGGFVLLALGFHGVLVGTLKAFSVEHSVKESTGKVVFQVVEPPSKQEKQIQKIEPESAHEAEQEPASEVAPQSKLKSPPEKKLKRRVPMAKADPVNMENPEPTPSPKKRAVVGITMSSTVTGGSGPAYAVGNTRMGRTEEKVLHSEKLEPLSRGKQSGTGGAAGIAEASANRKATFVPTVSSDFVRPKRLTPVDLPYPQTLKSKGIEGNVVVLIVINEQGTVQKVRILKSSGYREFDEAALHAAQKELYAPARRDGQAVVYNLKYTYRFRMKGA